MRKFGNIFSCNRVGFRTNSIAITPTKFAMPNTKIPITRPSLCIRRLKQHLTLLFLPADLDKQQYFVSYVVVLGCGHTTGY